MKSLKLVIIAIPLLVILAIGLTAAQVSDAAGWLDDQCREWFNDIWKGVE